MKDSSGYIAYLPEVLWVEENDPSGFLGRFLRIFERILTGIPIRAQAVRAEGTMVSAAGNQIAMASAGDAARFRVGDQVQMVGTPHVRTVVDVDVDPAAPALVLDSPVPALGGGTVRIADLQPGQTRLRLDDVRYLGPGSPIRISQGAVTEDAVVQAVDAEQVTVTVGLTSGFTMNATAMPVTVEDGTALQARNRTYDDFETTIDHLADLFSPWRTREELLPWLASWVALPLRQDWSDYQKRWLTARITNIYRQRGLKPGLLTYLDIFAPSAAQPRVVVDDGDAVLRLDRQDNGSFAVREVAHSNTAAHAGGTVTVLLHPSGLAVDAAGDYLVTDQGDATLIPQRPAALWRLTRAGHVPYRAAGLVAPLPSPVHSGPPLALPTAVVVDATDRASVVDIGSTTFVNAGDLFSRIVRFAPPAFTPVIVIDQATAPSLPAVHPVDMVLDGAGRFIVLDRGLHPFGDPPQGPTAPRIVVVSEGPLATSVQPLTTVVEPTAITMDPAGRFIVADARDQLTTTPANLVRVDPAAGFAETSLLAAVPAGSNPLVYPTGLTFEGPNMLLVCDPGVRMGFVGDTTNRTMAEDAAVYRVDLSQTPPTITRVTRERSLVTPSKLAIDRQGSPVLVDRGETLRGPPARSWRARANEFGVTLLFSAQRPTTFQDRNLVRRAIFDVVDEQKPAHTVWWLDI